MSPKVYAGFAASVFIALFLICIILMGNNAHLELVQNG
ncbi:hypothetical protein M2418_002161 [Rhizobium sp. BIGb0125]|jgi:hypothetical protein|nr:hypothetical protein [Rhizobium sp. BIGb0125]